MVLLAVYCTIIRATPEVFCVDRIPKPLYKAREVATIPFDFARKRRVLQQQMI
jgi:hypothetical protein